MRRILHLDGIRGVLALSVAASHVYGSIYQWNSDRPLVGAYLAVDFFFILSGYVLTYTLVKAESAPWWKFIAKRLFRLWPLHAACLVATIAVINNNGLTHQYVPQWWATLSRWQILGNFLLLQNVGSSHVPVINDPSWSISIEFWVSSIVLFLDVRINRLWFSLGLAFAAWGGIFLLHGPNLFTQGNFIEYVNFGVMRGIGGMSFGNALFQLYRRGISDRWHWLGSTTVQAIFTCVVALAIYAQNGRPWVEVPVLLAFAGMVLFMDSDKGMGRLFSLRPLVWLGEISFAVYLCHTPIILCASPPLYAAEFGHRAPFMLLAVVIVVAYIAHVAIERPSRQFLYGLVRTRESAPEQVSATR